jgi:hypothetical protein
MILSGSININDIFSNKEEDLPIGMLIFKKDGSMSLAVTEDKDPIDLSSILMLVDFFEYALQKKEWMNMFADHIEKLGIELIKDKRPKLRLIKGGLESSGSIK